MFTVQERRSKQPSFNQAGRVHSLAYPVKEEIGKKGSEQIFLSVVESEEEKERKEKRPKSCLQGRGNKNRRE